VINPARQLYLNMDIDNLKDTAPEQPTGLLAPKRMGSNIPKEAANQPAFRVAQHMKILRDKRKALKNGN
jgi:putative hemolysin